MREGSARAPVTRQGVSSRPLLIGEKPAGQFEPATEGRRLIESLICLKAPDVMVIHDAATFPGLVVVCRVIGILQLEQKSKNKSERNDRVFAVPLRSHSEKAIRDVRDLTGPFQEELEKFFIATDELEDKKLNILGWKGPDSALKAVRNAAKSFTTDE
jgi:hypothetical protein